MSKEFENAVLDFISFAKEKFNTIDKRFDNIETILNQHDEQFKSLHQSLAIIESKVLSDFPALFEAFELHQQLHKEYDEKLSYLSRKTEENSMKISVLEDQMKFIKTN